MLNIMKALIATGTGTATVTSVEDPPVRDTYIKIRVRALALNPTDYKHVFNFTRGGEIVGCDVAGEVIAIGQQVTSPIKIGDHIAGLTHGCNSSSPRDGGFAEHAEIKDGIFAHVPESWGWGKGATLGAGVTTAGQGLFQALGLPLPGVAKAGGPRETVLIYGGSTATGCLAVQYARLAGLRVIVLASPGQFERLRGLGADECYDYHEEGIGTKIRRETGDGLMFAFDIITNEGSMRICADALASGEKEGKRPRCAVLLPGKTFPRDDVDVHLTSGYSVIGETSTKYGKLVEGEPEDYKFGRAFWALTDRLIKEGRLTAHDVGIRPGGLEGVVSGLEDLRDGKVKGHKLVYELE